MAGKETPLGEQVLVSCRLISIGGDLAVLRHRSSLAAANRRDAQKACAPWDGEWPCATKTTLSVHAYCAVPPCLGLEHKNDVRVPDQSRGEKKKKSAVGCTYGGEDRSKPGADLHVIDILNKTTSCLRHRYPHA
jgi:hypothetical protein